MPSERPASNARRLIGEATREAEVGQIGVPVLVQQHVRGLDVAMDEPPCVSGVEGFGDLCADGDRAGGLERALLLQQALEIRALDVAHGEVELPVGLAGVVDRDDVGMLERGSEARLDEEALAKPAILGKAWREQLERDGSLERDVVGAVDDAHATAPEQLLDAVAE